MKAGVAPRAARFPRQGRSTVLARFAPERAALEFLLLALRLGGDLLELDGLQRRERLAQRALLGVAEGAAVGLHTLADVGQELALPVGELHARLVGGAAGALQRIEGGALGRRLAGLQGRDWRLLPQISPIAER